MRTKGGGNELMREKQICSADNFVCFRFFVLKQMLPIIGDNQSDLHL